LACPVTVPEIMKNFEKILIHHFIPNESYRIRLETTAPKKDAKVIKIKDKFKLTVEKISDIF
jgi:hypothetical protein